MKCVKCASDMAPTAKFCLKCGASQPTQQHDVSTLTTLELEMELSPKNQTIVSTGDFFPKLRIRYQDAYAVARGLVTTGNLIKIASLVAGGVLALIGIIVMSSGADLGGIEGLLLILLAVSVAGGGFVTGILTAASGQFMSATIDTAVNTSQNISGEEKAEILGLC